MDVRYREAKRTDIGDIVDFQIAMARETEDVALDRATCTRGVEAVFDDPSHGRYFIAEVEGRVGASLLITYEWSDWRDGNVWWIQSVFVRPELRKQRIYGGLYEHVQKIVAAHDSIKGIRLYVDKRNTRAQEVYRRCGMNGEHYLVYEWMK